MEIRARRLLPQEKTVTPQEAKPTAAGPEKERERPGTLNKHSKAMETQGTLQKLMNKLKEEIRTVPN